jgi:hypothetical protein
MQAEIEAYRQSHDQEQRLLMMIKEMELKNAEIE